MKMHGKKVIISGAGKGIGRSTAQYLAEEGCDIHAISRSRDDLVTLKDEIGGRFAVADLSDAQQARAAAEDMLPADLLVNCAGTTTLSPFLNTKTEDFDRLMALNCRAAMIVAQVYARHRITAGAPGAIVNVSSASAFTGFADHTAYCASKGALDAMSRVMAVELGPKGVRVNCVNPVVTLTPMAAKAWSDPAKAEPVLARIPQRRFVEPEEVAATIAFLLSDAASMVNGVSLSVDGGFQVS